jgi:hypothetical protein
MTNKENTEDLGRLFRQSMPLLAEFLKEFGKSNQDFVFHYVNPSGGATTEFGLTWIYGENDLLDLDGRRRYIAFAEDGFGGQYFADIAAKCVSFCDQSEEVVIDLAGTETIFLQKLEIFR